MRAEVEAAVVAEVAVVVEAGVAVAAAVAMEVVAEVAVVAEAVMNLTKTLMLMIKVYFFVANIKYKLVLQ